MKRMPLVHYHTNGDFLKYVHSSLWPKPWATRPNLYTSVNNMKELSSSWRSNQKTYLFQSHSLPWLNRLSLSLHTASHSHPVTCRFVPEHPFLKSHCVCQYGNGPQLLLSWMVLSVTKDSSHLKPRNNSSCNHQPKCTQMTGYHHWFHHIYWPPEPLTQTPP